MLPFKARQPSITHKQLYSPWDSHRSTEPNDQRKNLRYKSAYHQRKSLPDAPPRRHDSDPESRTLTVRPSLYSTNWAPPPICLVNWIFIALWMPIALCANQKLGSSKQTLGGEWSRPFCSRPRGGSSKGPKPVVCEDQKGYSPEDQCFLSIF